MRDAAFDPFWQKEKETVTVKVANDEIKAYMETVFTKATIVVDSTLAE